MALLRNGVKGKVSRFICELQITDYKLQIADYKLSAGGSARGGFASGEGSVFGGQITNYPPEAPPEVPLEVDSPQAKAPPLADKFFD